MIEGEGVREEKGEERGGRLREGGEEEGEERGGRLREEGGSGEGEEYFE